MPDNTRRAYQAQWRLWLDWCAGADVDPLPSDPLQVVNWLAERAEAGQSHAGPTPRWPPSAPSRAPEGPRTTTRSTSSIPTRWPP